MKYKTYGNNYESVCDFLGWAKRIHAIQVCQKKDVLYCTGTMLKPNEWEQLKSKDKSILPNGKILKITHCPL